MVDFPICSFRNLRAVDIEWWFLLNWLRIWRWIFKEKNKELMENVKWQLLENYSGFFGSHSSQSLIIFNSCFDVRSNRLTVYLTVLRNCFDDINNGFYLFYCRYLCSVKMTKINCKRWKQRKHRQNISFLFSNFFPFEKHNQWMLNTKLR